MTDEYPKRLIEVDLPIRRISEIARREKAGGKGHIPELHIYPAARPLASCRAVICAVLWLDPADDACSQVFCQTVYEALHLFAKGAVSDPSLLRICFRNQQVWKDFSKQSLRDLLIKDRIKLRQGMFSFIEDFAQPQSTLSIFSTTANLITVASHKSTAGEKADVRPLIVDPFAGGGAIPLAALQSGADTYASDLNPLAIIINKLIAEIIPAHGKRISQHLRQWLEWVMPRARNLLNEYYPSSVGEEVPIAYIWARTVSCEGPGCGAEIPLLRRLLLSSKGPTLKIIPNKKKKTINFDIVNDVTSEVGGGGGGVRLKATPQRAPCAVIQRL